MLFLGIISWKGGSHFNGGGEGVFQIGGRASFLSGGLPHGGIGFDGGGTFKKNLWMGEGPTLCPPLWETLPYHENQRILRYAGQL